MSTDRQYNKVVFICDGCEQSLETGLRDFYEALDRMKEEGWRSEKGAKRDDGWQHFCPQC